MNLTFTFVALVIILSSQVHADSCEPVDHRAQLPPTRDQVGFAWCYAFTVADLLSFETRTSISAVGVGIQTQRNYVSAYNAVTWMPDIVDYFTRPKRDQTYDMDRGAPVAIALRANLDNGNLCRESDLPQRMHPVLSEDPKSRFQLQGTSFRLTELRELIQNPSLREREILPPGEPLCTRTDSSARALFPSINIDDFRKIVLALESGHDPLGEFYDLACTNPVPLNPNLTIVNEERRGDGQNLIEALNTQLTRSPAALVFDGALLTDPNFASSDLPNHSAVIVARRQNPENGVCEYLLRNSWGPSCAYYQPGLRCEEGNIWLPQTLVEKANSIVGLQ